jgi:hypothetical protein
MFMDLRKKVDFQLVTIRLFSLRCGLPEKLHNFSRGLNLVVFRLSVADLPSPESLAGESTGTMPFFAGYPAN